MPRISLRALAASLRKCESLAIPIFRAGGFDGPPISRPAFDRSRKVPIMKLIVALLAGVFIATAQAATGAEHPNSFPQKVAPGLEFSGQIDVINAVGNLWKPLAQILEISDEGFAGTIVTAEGKKIKFDGSFKNAGAKWACSVKWEAESETPDTFILLSHTMPLDQVRNAEIRSDAQVISFAKMLEQTPTLTNLAGASEFTLGPVDGATIDFTLYSPMNVQAVQFGENMCVRILLSPQKDPLPASGSAEWTLEKQK